MLRGLGLPIGTNDSQRRWETRVLRAQELLDHHPQMTLGLQLYRATLEFQSEVARGSGDLINPGIPLRKQIDLAALSAKMRSILSAGSQYGPDPLRLAAHQLQQTGEEKWRQLLEAALVPGESILDGADDFFARACLQPVAEHLQLQLPKDANYYGSVCPACAGLPQMAVLHPEGEGASRWLLCSFCLCEWPFRRIVCPWCGEENKEKLPRYSAEECAYVHVEACDTCQRYLKSVDMTIDGRAVPLVDEAALAVLDVWATDRGYTKIVRNLIGF